MHDFHWVSVQSYKTDLSEQAHTNNPIGSAWGKPAYVSKCCYELYMQSDYVKNAIVD